MQPKIRIQYRPTKPGFVSAQFYVESESDVYGWYAQSRGQRFHASFFMVENFYTKRTTVLYRSVEDDVYGPWITASPSNDNEVRCPLPEPVRHELERLQSWCVEEWLFFENDPDAEAELAAYRSLELPVHPLNIKARKLRRIPKTAPGWDYSTAGSDPNVADLLEKHWHHLEKETSR
jgi:hypothetical protein